MCRGGAGGVGCVPDPPRLLPWRLKAGIPAGPAASFQYFSLVVLSRIVAVVAAIRVVIVLNTRPARTLPVSWQILRSIMVWLNPERALIGRTAPVAAMPLVVAADRIPVASYKCVSRSWAGMPNLNSGWWRRSDVNTNRYAAEHGTRSQQH